MNAIEKQISMMETATKGVLSFQAINSLSDKFAVIQKIGNANLFVNETVIDPVPFKFINQNSIKETDINIYSNGFLNEKSELNQINSKIEVLKNNAIILGETVREKLEDKDLNISEWFDERKVTTISRKVIQEMIEAMEIHFLNNEFSDFKKIITEISDIYVSIDKFGVVANKLVKSINLPSRNVDGRNELRKVLKLLHRNSTDEDSIEIFTREKVSKNLNIIRNGKNRKNKNYRIAS